MGRWRNQERHGWIERFAIVSYLICLLTGTLYAEVLSGKIHEKLIKSVQDELDRQYRSAQMTEELFPGATVAFVLPDGKVMAFATGFSDIEKKTVMSVESRMPAGSIGKTFVSAVVLSMVSEGIFNLDEKIIKWLGDEPWFNRLPNHHMITLRHLLNHSSGLIDHVFDANREFQDYFKEHINSGNKGPRIDPTELVQFVLDREPLFPAGEGFHYSDTNYILVGLIIEKAGKLTYYEELANRFLTPLNLTHTSALTQKKLLNIAQGYAPKSQKLFGTSYTVLDNGTFTFDPSIEWTGGGVVSNTKDLARWAKVLFEGKVIKQPYLDEMLKSVSTPMQGRDIAGRAYGYGLGVSIVKTNYGTAFRHGGFFPGYNSMLAYFPDFKIAVAMQINSDNTKIEEHFEAIVKLIIGTIASGCLDHSSLTF